MFYLTTTTSASIDGDLKRVLQLPDGRALCANLADAAFAIPLADRRRLWLFGAVFYHIVGDDEIRRISGDDGEYLAGVFSQSSLAAAIPTVEGHYVGLLAVWSAQCYYAYFWLCRNAVDRTVAGVETPFPMWAALLLAVVVYLAVVLRRRQLRLIVGALALLAYAGWSCFTVGWCTLKPSYTVVEASVPLRRFVRRGDCMRFWLREGNQGFALCLENDATPMFMLGRTSLKAQRTDTSLAFRAYSITLRRRTTWRWAQSPLEAPVPEFDIEEELPVLRLIPNPLGVHSHDVRVLILKRRQPTE